MLLIYLNVGFLSHHQLQTVCSSLSIKRISQTLFSPCGVARVVGRGEVVVKQFVAEWAAP